MTVNDRFYCIKFVAGAFVGKSNKFSKIIVVNKRHQKKCFILDLFDRTDSFAFHQCFEFSILFIH